MSLGQRKADVIELYQPLTPNMTEIQSAIVECMDATLAELRKSCSGVRPPTLSRPRFLLHRGLQALTRNPPPNAYP